MKPRIAKVRHWTDRQASQICFSRASFTMSIPSLRTPHEWWEVDPRGRASPQGPAVLPPLRRERRHGVCRLCLRAEPARRYVRRPRPPSPGRRDVYVRANDGGYQVKSGTDELRVRALCPRGGSCGLRLGARWGHRKLGGPPTWLPVRPRWRRRSGCPRGSVLPGFLRSSSALLLQAPPAACCCCSCAAPWDRSAPRR